jgi:hypothetical protein
MNDLSLWSSRSDHVPLVSQVCIDLEPEMDRRRVHVPLFQESPQQDFRSRSLSVAICHDAGGLGGIKVLPELGFAGAFPGGRHDKAFSLGISKFHNILIWDKSSFLGYRLKEYISPVALNFGDGYEIDSSDPT